MSQSQGARVQEGKPPVQVPVRDQNNPLARQAVIPAPASTSLPSPTPTPNQPPPQNPKPVATPNISLRYAGGGGALVSPSGKGTTFVNSTPTQVLNRYNSPAFQKNILPAAEALGVVGVGIVAPEIVIPSVLVGEGAYIGINSGVKSLTSGKAQAVLPSTPREVLDVAAESTVFGLVGAGAVGAVGKAVPQLAGDVANPLVRSATRIGVNAGLGAGASALLSGGNPTATVKGAGLGAGFGALGEGINAIGNTDLFQNVKENIVGAKFTELTGAKELANQNTEGKVTTIEQITEPTTETVTLRGQDISFYRENNLSTLQNPVIDLSGTEKVYTPDPILGGKQVEPIPELRQVESTRTANPVLAALQGEGKYKLAIVKTGDASSFLETPSDTAAVQRTKVFVDLEKGQPPAIFSEKTVVTQGEAILPETKISFRDFTGVQIRGTPDEANVADVAKALPEDLANQIYKQLGGNYRPIVDYGSQAPKDLSGPMPKGSNVFFEDVAGGGGAKGTNTDPIMGDKAPSGVADTTQVNAAPKEITLPRAIVGEVPQTQGYQNIVKGVPVLFARGKQNQEEETTPLSYPASGLGHPAILGGTTTTNQKQRGTAKATVGFATIPSTKQPQGQGLIPTQTQLQKQTITPDILLGQGQGQPQIVTPIIVPSQTSTQMTPTYPEPTKKSSSTPLVFPFGGGGGGQGGNLFSGRSGRYFEVKNPVPSSKVVVGRFFGSSKGSRTNVKGQRGTNLFKVQKIKVTKKQGKSKRR